jgi:hypothetical protein
MQFCIGLLTVELWLCSFCSLDFRTLHDHCQRAGPPFELQEKCTLTLLSIEDFYFIRTSIYTNIEAFTF